MTKMLAVDDNNDLFIRGSGLLALNSDLDAVMQAAQHAAQAQLGEMILAIDQGVPNFQTIWESATNVAQFQAYLRRAIMSVDGVIEVRDLETEVRDNVIFYAATIVTIYGSGVLQNG